MSSALEEVLAGAKVLDKQCPGWYKKVNVDELDSSGPNCVLRQVYGNYLDSLTQLFGPGNNTNGIPTAHGFCGRQHDGPWRNLIRKRIVKDLCDELIRKAAEKKLIFCVEHTTKDKYIFLYDTKICRDGLSLAHCLHEIIDNKANVSEYFSIFFDASSTFKPRDVLSKYVRRRLLRVARRQQKRLWAK